MNTFALSTALLISAATIAGCAQSEPSEPYEFHEVEPPPATPASIASEAILRNVEFLLEPHTSIGTKSRLIDGPAPQNVAEIDQLLQQKYAECDNGRMGFWINNVEMQNDAAATANIKVKCRTESVWHSRPAMSFVRVGGEWKITDTSLVLLLDLYSEVRHPR